MFWCLGVEVLGVFGVKVSRCQVVKVLRFRVNDILDGQKGDQGGGPKMAKIQYGGKTGHLQEGGPKMAKILGGVKFQHFWASSSAIKVLSNS